MHEMEPLSPLTPIVSSHGSVFPAHRRKARRVTADRCRAVALQAINTAPNMGGGKASAGSTLPARNT